MKTKFDCGCSILIYKTSWNWDACEVCINKNEDVSYRVMYFLEEKIADLRATLKASQDHGEELTAELVKRGATIEKLTDKLSMSD